MMSVINHYACDKNEQSLQIALLQLGNCTNLLACLKSKVE